MWASKGHVMPLSVKKQCARGFWGDFFFFFKFTNGGMLELHFCGYAALKTICSKDLKISKR